MNKKTIILIKVINILLIKIFYKKNNNIKILNYLKIKIISIYFIINYKKINNYF